MAANGTANGTASALVNLSVSYSSSGNEPFTANEALTAPPSASVADKTRYLSHLRMAVSSMQEHINKELTARMEEDKAKAGTQDAPADAALDEAKEEENYGEEAAGGED